MKRIFALLLAAIMLMGVFAGCSNDAPETTAPAANGGENTPANDGEVQVEQVNLKVWVPEEEMEIAQAMCAAFDEYYEQFECTFDISVTGIDLSANGLETDPELAADVFQLPSGSIAQLTNAGLLYPITANSDEVKALYGEGAIEASSLGGYMYGVPFSPNSWFMYYNKDLYTEEEVKSLDVMMAKDLGEGVQNFSCDLDNGWYIEAFFYATGATLFGADGTDATNMTWNAPEGLAAANYIIDLVNNPKYLEDKDGIAGAMMKDGKLGALSSGTWAYPDLHEQMGDKLGAVALPTITVDGKECQLSNFADYKVWSVKSNTKHPMAAQLLAEWLANEENQMTRYQVAGASPTCLSLLDNPDVAANVAATALIAQTQYATPQPSIAQIANYWTPAQALGTEILSGAANAENIQAKLDQLVNDVTSSLVG